MSEAPSVCCACRRDSGAGSKIRGADLFDISALQETDYDIDTTIRRARKPTLTGLNSANCIDDSDLAEIESQEARIVASSKRVKKLEPHPVSFNNPVSAHLSSKRGWPGLQKLKSLERRH